MLLEISLCQKFSACSKCWFYSTGAKWLWHEKYMWFFLENLGLFCSWRTCAEGLYRITGCTQGGLTLQFPKISLDNFVNKRREGWENLTLNHSSEGCWKLINNPQGGPKCLVAAEAEVLRYSGCCSVSVSLEFCLFCLEGVKGSTHGTRRLIPVCTNPSCKFSGYFGK